MLRLSCIFGAILLVGCVTTHPKDLELASVRVVDKRSIAERAAPPVPGSRSLVDPYHAFLMDLWEKKQGEPISPADMAPYFQWYSSNEALQQTKTSEPVLKIEFSSQTNLADEIAGSGQVISIRQYFCSRPDYSVLLGPPGIYIQGLELESIFDYDVSPEDGRYIYYSFIDVSDTPKTPSTYNEYNLESAPENVCLQVRRKAMGFGYKSNVVMVPAEAITAALKEADVEAVDSTQ